MRKSSENSKVRLERYILLTTVLLIWLNFYRYPFDSAHHEIIDSLIDDKDEELTSDFGSNAPSVLLSGEDNVSSNNNQDPTQLNYVFPSYSNNFSLSSLLQEKDYVNTEILVVDDSQTEKPQHDKEIYQFLVRVHRLSSNVRVFVSMVCQVSALQRHIHNKLGPSNGGFILDVRISF